MKTFAFFHCAHSESLNLSISQPFNKRRRRAFTLVELLLVVVIVAITAAVAMPSLVESIRWHRLRAASHTLVTIARYSRSMAILKQCNLSISFNLDTGQIDMISSNASLPRFTRVVEGVTLESVEMDGGNSFTAGACAVPYSRNGTCRPFAVKIRDNNGNYILVKVDALSSCKTLESGKQ